MNNPGQRRTKNEFIEWANQILTEQINDIFHADGTMAMEFVVEMGGEVLVCDDNGCFPVEHWETLSEEYIREEAKRFNEATK